MKQRIRIRLPEPCSEDWEQMTPVERGRHCASCRKTVVDFTRMSDAELIRFLQAFPETACGRFGKSQLNRTLAQPPSRREAVLKKLAMKLAASLLTLHLAATGAFAQAPLRQRQHQTATERNNQQPKELRGRLQDALTGQPLGGIELELRGTDQRTVTDPKDTLLSNTRTRYPPPV